MENFSIKYFLAANSCEGFISGFANSYDPKNGWKAYIIKGGPGTGKSSFMKFIAVKAAETGLKCELCPCSSDPDSLDAVIIPEKKVVIMDGTAPHTVDPVYPAVCEEILNFGQFWKNESFKENSQAIIAVTDKNKALHRATARYLKAAGQFMLDNLKIASACTESDKTERFAKALCKKYIPKGSGNGYEWVRYLCGITPKGVVSYANTILNTCDKTVIIDDEFGSCANIIMNCVRDYALKNGYSIITIKNAFLPSVLTDHIIIPELSLAFVREYEFQHFNIDQRRIHARRFINAVQLKRSRERIKFNKKALRQLLLSAAAILAEAKSLHDDLEKYYINAMDFEALTTFAESFTKKLLM